MSKAKLLLAASLSPLAAALVGVPALAQDVPGAEADDTTAISEVIVTARRREENLQDVPAAVTAVSAEGLADIGVATLEDMTSVAPNIKVNAGRGTNSTINAYIRGVGQNDPLWGFEPGVGIYIDDVYVARPQAALLDVYDVERIEVLRGPQGTLYGKNTLAGAIKYVTRDIVGPSTWNVTLAAGNYQQIDLKAGGSWELSENVYLGASVARLTRDGYGEIESSATPQAFNGLGEDVSNKDVLSARVKLAFLFGEDGRLDVAGDMVRDRSNARGSQRLNDAFGGRLPDRFDVRSDLPVDQEEFDIGGVSATYTQPLAEAWDLKVVASRREGDGRQFIDFDTLNTNLFNVPAQYEDEQTSGELQFNYDAGGRFKGVSGLYYFDGEACGAFDAVLASAATSLTAGCVATQSTSVYGDGTYALTERLNLNAGVRWNEDDKEATVLVLQYAGALTGGQTLFDPGNPPPGIVFTRTDSDYASSRTFSDVSPRLGVDFAISDDVMVYASYAEGFKSGGFDMRGNARVFPDTRLGYDSETVTNYEVGLKSTWADGRLRMNLTGFFADYEDVQITTQQLVLVGGVPTNATAVLNAGAQENQGIELETLWVPVDGLNIAANVGWLDAEITEFLANGVNVAQLHEPINAPELTAYVGAGYRWALAGGEAFARLGYQYRDDTKVANTTVSITDQKAYEIWDATLAYETGAWRFAIDADNILDEEYLTSGYDFGAALGGASQIGFYGPPRTYTASVTYRFD
jgi:iron complex outermembrane recepter protein